jgi:hypothetical protein
MISNWWYLNFMLPFVWIALAVRDRWRCPARSLRRSSLLR